MPLLDRHGRPLLLEANRDVTNEYRRGIPQRSQPLTGDKFGAWAGRDLNYIALPGGAMLQFDLSALTLSDFRSMRDHYQINASLSVLSFILHQIDWEIKCDNQKIADFITEALGDIWTELIRALSQAFWAGFSPNVLNWDNVDGYLKITQIKDLVPEECKVHWKETPGYAPEGRVAPKMLSYDGIDQIAFGRYSTTTGGTSVSNSANTLTIPPENTLWWPLMRENGDYYGRKLLKPAFPAWYFSQIIHLFANRYYERFGEPTAIGRAPLEERIDDGTGGQITGKQAMERIMMNLRSRSVVVLPSDRDPATKEFDYELEYMESQMRGADFERYLSRLDEEMSLGVFTPMLLFRTASVGSYNLGQQHMKIFLWMLNAVAGDIKIYLQKFIIDRLREFNFGKSSPRATWEYRKLGKDDTQVLSQMLQALVSAGQVMPDLNELGIAIGIPLEKVEVLTSPDDPAAPKPTQGKGSTSVKTDQSRNKDTSVTAAYPSSLSEARRVVAEGIERAYRSHLNGKVPGVFGYSARLERALADSGADTVTAGEIAARFKNWVDPLLPELHGVAVDASEFRDMLGKVVDAALEDAVAA